MQPFNPKKAKIYFLLLQIVTLPIEELEVMREAVTECKSLIKKNLRHNKKLINYFNVEKNANDDLLEAGKRCLLFQN